MIKILIKVDIIFLLFFLINDLYAINNYGLILKKNNFQLVLSDGESEPLYLAANTLCDDFKKVMGVIPNLKNTIDSSKINIVITTERFQKEYNLQKYELDDFESHRIDVDKKCVFLSGKDMRGAIYAIYTFSEHFLKVPPLWFFSSWIPEHMDSIIIPFCYNYYQRSPNVRYRGWFPNDTDLFTPWRKLSTENNELWLETMLRLKLNTVELGSTVAYPSYKLNKQAELLKKYGLILASHHNVALNNSFLNWNGYWEKVRKVPVPKLLLSNEKQLIEFWRYSIETVCRSNIENIWQISFRGIKDEPFWKSFADSPENDRERADVINRMLNTQLMLIKEITKEDYPNIRITFYDELSDLLSAGYLKPPVAKNILWTFVATRRDHYPNKDLVDFNSAINVMLGYYFNLQFTSTGAHLAPAEGPWKMEANFRYVNKKAPLCLSIVNAGNIREFLLSLSANAKMMWDISSYETNSFLFDYCRQYYGEEYDDEIFSLYHDYFYSYWQQKLPDFYNIDRQYIFQDLRYACVYDQIASLFIKGKYSDNPLHDIGNERIKGRSFNIEGNNQVDSLLIGMKNSALNFGNVAKRCEVLIKKLPYSKRNFLKDNLYAYSLYMSELSFSMENFIWSYKCLDKKRKSRNYLKNAILHLEHARDALYITQDGVFSNWYKGDSINGKFDLNKKIKKLWCIYDVLN